MQTLLIATHNQGKVREYRELLAELPVELTSLDEMKVAFEVDETGETFGENAERKAAAYAEATGLWTWADDSGLEVDALGGAPGVFSARYGGAGLGDAGRCRKLLDALAGIRWDRRSARFCCAVAIVSPAGQACTSYAECEGIIAFGPAGENGFGYDPIFYLPSLGSTMAQLAPAQKNRVSHRAQAARQAAECLQQMLAG